MTAHLMRELDTLRKRICFLMALVEDNLALAVQAVQTRNEDMAQQVIRRDAEIDSTEVAVEEECLKLLALYQPVAVDLRFVIAVLKLNNDLERIGDLAVNIAKRAIFLSRLPVVSVPFDFDTMAKKSAQMLRKSLDALLEGDASMALEVCAMDDEVDAINSGMYARVKTSIKKYPEHLDALINLLSVSKNIERVADHATNIAEDVIYLVEGRIIRHAPGRSAARSAVHAES